MLPGSKCPSETRLKQSGDSMSSILVINAGSSSLKFQLFARSGIRFLAGGVIERIGLADTQLVYTDPKADQAQKPVHVRDIGQAIAEMIRVLSDDATGVIEGRQDVAAIGHRVVHGGEEMVLPMKIDQRVKQVIREHAALAPLHNPANLDGIAACESHFPGVPAVAVFDTAFHATVPERAYLYGLPRRMYRKDRIRRYGFHGISHQYVCHAAAVFLDRSVEDLRIISCHLGNGCSICAVDGGISIDISMGFTPLEGLIMGTRCGDLDPAIIFHLMERKHWDINRIKELLNHHSGLLGLAGIGSSDMRDILVARAGGNAAAGVAIDAFAYRIKKYLGAYSAAMGGLDVIVFTAGIGENSPDIREIICDGLEGMGIIMNTRRNAAPGQGARAVHDDRSRVKILVVPTQEEKQIAIETGKRLFQG